MKTTTREAIAMFPPGLISRAEQKPTMARAAELMRWCDTLEAQLRHPRTLGVHLLDSTLHHFLAA